MNFQRPFHVLPLFFSVFVFLFLFSLLFSACSFPSPASTLLLLAAFPQAGNIGDILKSSRIVCSNIYQPEVERSIEPGQTQKAFGTDIPVSNAAGNGRSFRAMMRPDTHILVNIFNRVSDRRDVREIRSRVHDRTESPDAPFSPYNNVVARRTYVCISMQILYQSNGFTSLPALFSVHYRTILLQDIIQYCHAKSFSNRGCICACMRAHTHEISENECLEEYREALLQDKRKEILNCAVDERCLSALRCVKDGVPVLLESCNSVSRRRLIYILTLPATSFRVGDVQRAHRERYAECLYA